jgi:hypothetical protein
MLRLMVRLVKVFADTGAVALNEEFARKYFTLSVSFGQPISRASIAWGTVEKARSIHAGIILPRNGYSEFYWLVLFTKIPCVT